MVLTILGVIFGWEDALRVRKRCEAADTSPGKMRFC